MLEREAKDIADLLTAAANVREDLHPGRVPISRNTLRDTVGLILAQSDRIRELEAEIEELEQELGLHEEEG